MKTKLVELRKMQAFTQYTFAAAVGTSRSHYGQIETGDKSPSFRLSRRIKKQLGYYDDDLFDNTSIP